MPKESSKKCARVEEAGQESNETDTDLRLSEALRVLMVGRTHVKQEGF